MHAATKLAIVVGLIGAFALGRYGSEPTDEPVRAPPPLRASPPAPPAASTDPEPRTGPIRPYDRFVAHLNGYEWTEAMEIFDRIYRRGTDTEIATFRVRLLDTARAYLRTAPARAVELLFAYTGGYLYDSAALRLLAEGQQRLGDSGTALRTLKAAYQLAHAPADLTAIQSQTETVLDQHRRRLAARGDYSRMIAVYQGLIHQQPGYGPYYLGLAEAHLEQGNESEARRALRYIQFDGELGERARHELARLHPSEAARSQFSVPLTVLGNHFVVSVLVNDVPLRLLLDTGASLTVLSRASAERVGAQLGHGRVSLTTANGVVHAPLALVERLQIGHDDPWSELRAAIIDLHGPASVDGLLGMDVLSRYRMTIDRDQATLRLAR